METLYMILLGMGVLVLIYLQLRPRIEHQGNLMIQQQMESLRQQFSQNFDRNISMVNKQLEVLTTQLNQRLAQINQEVNLRLKENIEILTQTNTAIGNRLDSSSLVIQSVNLNLGKIEETNKQILNISQDLKNLEIILSAPKLRGGLGELFLGELLRQIIPPKYFTEQYEFRNGEKVDAVIHLYHGMVPVDSKFPLENFKRSLDTVDEQGKKGFRKKFVSDVKKHIDIIRDKYIRPDEGTFGFALMYIPAENVYYETIIREEAEEEKSISQYAQSKNVIPVSPNSFFAYLQSIAFGLKGLQVEERAQEIIQTLGRLRGDFGKFKEEFEILGAHLEKAQKKFFEADKILDKFNNKLESVEKTADIPEPSPQILLEEK